MSECDAAASSKIESETIRTDNTFLSNEFEKY